MRQARRQGRSGSAGRGDGVLQANRITPGQALELLRAQAFSADRLLDDLAEDIVGGRLPVPAL